VGNLILGGGLIKILLHPADNPGRAEVHILGQNLPGYFHSRHQLADFLKVVAQLRIFHPLKLYYLIIKYLHIRILQIVTSPS